MRLGSMGSMSNMGTGQHGIGRIRAPRARNCFARNDRLLRGVFQLKSTNIIYTYIPGKCPGTQGGTGQTQPALRTV